MSNDLGPQVKQPEEAKEAQAQPADAWGQPISDDQKNHLDALAQQQRLWIEQSEAIRGSSYFKDVRLTGADVFWLAQRALAGPDASLSSVATEAKRLLTSNPDERLSVSLRALHLEGANLINTHLEEALLKLAHLEGADLGHAHLEGADLLAAHLEGADLGHAYLKGADLRGVHLEGADLTWASLDAADLRGAHLDSKTMLREADLNNETWLGDIQWSGPGTVDLTQIDWERVPRLGDERFVDLNAPISYHRAVVRAYRQLAAQLRAQGMAEEADRFSYRAQIRQRAVLLRTLRLPQYLFSWLLAILAGYGYRPGRTLFWYLAVVLGYAFAYLHVGPSVGVPLSPLGALVFSVTSFHGRGFFPGGSPGHSITLDDPLTVLAASEAIVGLLIEISFIATFTQRYFGAK